MLLQENLPRQSHITAQAGWLCHQSDLQESGDTEPGSWAGQSWAFWSKGTSPCAAEQQQQGSRRGTGSIPGSLSLQDPGWRCRWNAALVLVLWETCRNEMPPGASACGAQQCLLHDSGLLPPGKEIKPKRQNTELFPRMRLSQKDPK